MALFEWRLVVCRSCGGGICVALHGAPACLVITGTAPRVAFTVVFREFVVINMLLLLLQWLLMIVLVLFLLRVFFALITAVDATATTTAATTITITTTVYHVITTSHIVIFISYSANTVHLVGLS